MITYQTIFGFDKATSENEQKTLLHVLQKKGQLIKKPFQEYNFFEIIDKTVFASIEFDYLANTKTSKRFVTVYIDGYYFDVSHYEHTHQSKKAASKQVQQAIQEYIELTKTVYSNLKPQFGFGGETNSLTAQYPDFNECIFWLNLFGPEKVKQIGKQKLLTAPAYKIEELKDGGIFIQTTYHPLDLKEKYRSQSDPKLALAKHLEFLKLPKTRLKDTENGKYE